MDERDVNAEAPELSPEAAAEKELEQLVLARQERAAARAAQDRLEQVRIKIADEKAIAAAEAEYGEIDRKIRIVETDLGCVIVKQSNPLLYRQFQSAGKTDPVSLEKLVRPCVVYPDRNRFDEMVDAQPALQLRTANAVAYLAGSRAEDVQGK